MSSPCRRGCRRLGMTKSNCLSGTSKLASFPIVARLVLLSQAVKPCLSKAIFEHTPARSGLLGRRFRSRTEELLVHSADDLIHMRGRHRETDVELTGALCDGDHAHIAAGHNGEEPAENATRSLHA